MTVDDHQGSGFKLFWDRVRSWWAQSQVRALVRFDYFFAATIFLPTLLLSYFALSSIQAQELMFDADISDRSSAIRARVTEEKRELFNEFEERVAERLERGQVPVSSLRDLSPFLLTAFELDDAGNILAPFRPPEDHQPLYHSENFEQAFNAGLRLEQQGYSARVIGINANANRFYREANQQYALAQQATTDTRLKGQAMFAGARALWRSGTENPEDGFGDIIANFPTERDERGFRLADLARLTQAEIGLQRDSVAGLYAMRELVDQLLSEKWTIGEAGESQIAARALNQLEKMRSAGAEIDASWISQSRSRLNERKTHLYWSRALLNELAAVISRAPAGNNSVAYQPGQARQSVLWATLKANERMYVFGFDQTKILLGLESQAVELASLDPDIQARIRSSTNLSNAREMITNLGPEFPYTELVIALSDPRQLANRKWRLRTIRIFIVFLAIGLTGLGIFLSTRMIAHQMETARTKADFAANVSHELRSPITQIRLKGEALQLDLCTDDADRQQHYNAIVRESERLSRLVDNVLDFSAIERGTKSYIFRPEDVSMLVHTTIAGLEGSFEAQNAEVHFNLPDNLPVVWVDREAISQVIINLVSNAVKYGGDSKWVSVSAQQTSTGVEISVADRGIGINEKDLKHVFDNFYRSNSVKVRKEKGTGIGLTIVRYIVEAHGGVISVTSKPGEGTTFTIHLPLEAPKSSGA